MNIKPLDLTDKNSIAAWQDYLRQARLSPGIKTSKEPERKITQEELDKLYLYISGKVFFIRTSLVDRLEYHARISEYLNRFSELSKISSIDKGAKRIIVRSLAPPLNLNNPLLGNNVALVWDMNKVSVLSKDEFCNFVLNIEEKGSSLARELISDLWYQSFYGMIKTKSY